MNRLMTTEKGPNLSIRARVLSIFFALRIRGHILLQKARLRILPVQ
jgi:hypothetical protein